MHDAATAAESEARPVNIGRAGMGSGRTNAEVLNGVLDALTAWIKDVVASSEAATGR